MWIKRTENLTEEEAVRLEKHREEVIKMVENDPEADKLRITMFMNPLVGSLILRLFTSYYTQLMVLRDLHDDLEDLYQRIEELEERIKECEEQNEERR